MNDTNNNSTADTADRHRYLMVSMLFILSLKYAISAITHFADEKVVRYLKMTELGLVILMFAVIAPTMYWKFRNLSKETRKVYFSEDSFLFAILKKSFNKSWVVTFFVLVTFEILTKNLLANLPPRFFVQLTLSIMLCSLSVVFLVLSREDSETEETLDV